MDNIIKRPFLGSSDGLFQSLSAIYKESYLYEWERCYKALAPNSDVEDFCSLIIRYSDVVVACSNKGSVRRSAIFTAVCREAEIIWVGDKIALYTDKSVLVSLIIDNLHENLKNRCRNRDGILLLQRRIFDIRYFFSSGLNQVLGSMFTFVPYFHANEVVDLIYAYFSAFRVVSENLTVHEIGWIEYCERSRRVMEYLKSMTDFPTSFFTYSDELGTVVWVDKLVEFQHSMVDYYKLDDSVLGSIEKLNVVSSIIVATLKREIAILSEYKLVSTLMSVSTASMLSAINVDFDIYKK